MAVGYSAFSSSLKISGTSSVSSSWDIAITGISDAKVEGLAEETHTPTWDRLTASMEADLYQKGDSVSYDVTIENRGSLDATLEDISENVKSTNEAVRIMFTGYTKGQVLKAKSSQIVTVKIEYNPDFDGNAEEGSGEVSVTFNYTQYEGSTNTSGDTTAPQGKYLVNYNCDYNGGSDTPSILHNQYLSSGSAIDLTPQCTKADYTFLGWNTKSDATDTISSLNMTSNNITLYGIYKKPSVTYKVTYAKGSNVSAISKSSDTCTIPEVYNNNTQASSCSVVLPTITPNTGYTSLGFDTLENSTTGVTGSYALNSNITLYANAKANTYVINYMSNGGNGTMSNQSITYGSSVTIAKNTYTREGYTFKGWTTNSDGTDDGYGWTGWSGTWKYVNGQYGISSGKLTLYARWVDDTAPSIPTYLAYHTSESDTYTSGTWTSKQVYTKINTSDSGSGISKIQYSFDNGSTWGDLNFAASNGLSVSGSNASGVESWGMIDGRNNDVYFRAVDKAGNVSGKSKLFNIKYDLSAPTLSFNTSSTTNSITAVATASAASGISKYEFSKDGGKTWVNNGTNNTYTFTNLSNNANAQLKQNVVTSGDGLYADSTETGRYVYRGASPNNYIKLGSDMYRIISVESDGTLKVIKNGSIGSKAFDTQNARYSTISTDYCSSEYGCKVWGSKTTTLDTNGKNVTQIPREVNGTLYNLPDAEATLNTYLNNDWYNSLSSNVQNIVVSHMFNVGVTKDNETNLSNTITQEETYKWKGKVGLMNVSDYVKASTNSTCTSVNEYRNTSSCYNNSATHNWIFASLGSTYPWTIASSANSSAHYVFVVYSGGHLYDTSAFTSNGVAPVMYLNSSITLIGSGTSSDPYVAADNSYPIKARVTSGVGMTNISSTVPTSLKSITAPTFASTLTVNSKNVTITYPSGCGTSYTCSYSKDNGSFVTVTSNPTISFTDVGTLVAKVTDGTNTVSSSYSVSYVAKELGYDNTKSGLSSSNVQSALNEIKKKVG